jgi:hypothetical protein
MSIFGICFILYFLNLSARRGYWSNLRKSDPNLHKQAVTYQRCIRRKQKAELDLAFLLECKKLNVYPKFIKWKNIDNLPMKSRHKYHRLLLNDLIKNTNVRINNLTKQSDGLHVALFNSTTWMKAHFISFSINRLLKSEMSKVKARHNKKMDNLLALKNAIDGLQENPNNVILNLTGHNLSDEQIDVLKLGLRHGFATRPNELEMLSVAEDIWDQIARIDQFKEGNFVNDKLKNSSRSFTYNYLDLKQFHIDSKRIRILKKLNTHFAILKPDKGNGIVLLNRSDYVHSLNSLFDNPQKFKRISNDLTSTRLSTLQSYLCTLLNRSEINETEYTLLRPTHAHFARAHGLPKTHKQFDTLPKFRPIIDTTNTPHYNVGKFIAGLLNPITLNQFSLRDSFDAVEAIKSIPKDLFFQGYKFVSFDVESLFTNVPLRRTINIILDRVYKQNLIDSTLRKSTLKKLILDSCTKTIFSCNGTLYEQLDGVSMGSSLGPILANIILTEFENIIVSDLINTGVIKFYRRYVDDTLVLIRPSDIPHVLAQFNRF